MTDVEAPWFLTRQLRTGRTTSDGARPRRSRVPSRPGSPGRYLRNGSNPAGTARPAHWFFGDGMVHGIRLDGGRADWYRNRYVRTTKLGAPLEATVPATMMDPTASAANTHVLAHAGRIWALEEGAPARTSCRRSSTRSAATTSAAG